MKKLTAPKLMLGSPNIHADILYMTGFKAPDAVVVLQTPETCYLAVSRMELGRARAASAALTVVSPEDLEIPASQRRRLSAWAVALLKRAGARHADVPAAFPLGAARRIESAGVRLSVCDGAFISQRAIKRPDELEHLRAAQRATVAAMGTARELIRRAHVGRNAELRMAGAPLTAERVRRAINLALLERDCIGGEPIVACGAQGADPHGVGHGPLRAGEPIVIDIFPQHQETGYWGDLTRTLVKGPPSPTVRRMYRAVLAAQADALALVRAGRRGASIHRAAGLALERHGFANRTVDGVPEGFIHGTGHGVGLEIHEAPALARTDGVLRSGNVVTVEPGLYYREHGGMRIEDTVVVTRTGFEYLATCPKTLVVQ